MGEAFSQDINKFFKFEISNQGNIKQFGTSA
jgi:hypothetical protein